MSKHFDGETAPRPLAVWEAAILFALIAVSGLYVAWRFETTDPATWPTETNTKQEESK